MERKKIEKNLKDWANGLGFRLPSESTLPPDYFAALGATPHRRQLWETVVELVQPRKKIERMRKEILAARLKGFLGKFAGKEGDRLDLWEREKKFENDVREKKNEVSKLERSVLTKSSDLVLEICKLAELEKQWEEYKEKNLVLLLYKRRQKKMVGELETVMKNSKSGLLDTYQTLNSLKDEALKMEEPTGNAHHSTRFSNDSVTSEENLWDEVIEWKKSFHEKFEQLLEKIKSSETNLLSKKLSQAEENLTTSLMELKQKVTEQALEVMVNTKEGKMMDLKIEELTRSLEEMYRKDESFSESFSTARPEKEECLEMFTRHAKALSLKSYQDFLQDEMMKLGGNTNRKEAWDNREKFELIMKSLETINNEILALKVEKEKMSNEITARHDKLRVLLLTIREENEGGAYRKTVEETVASLKTALGKQIATFIQTPIDAFRKLETSSGRILFECESLPHCLNNYGGEWKEFFTAMLIPPTRNVSKILGELEKRKNLATEMRGFISKWEALVESQKKIQHSLSSIKSDSRICEKNFKEADGILWKISFKSEQLHPEVEFLKKILKNWVEQPYRLMIKEPETVNGLTLKQFEEAYSRENL